MSKENPIPCPKCSAPNYVETSCFACGESMPLQLEASAPPAVRSTDWMDAYAEIEGQITAMLARSEQYQREAEADGDRNEGEKHACVCSVLRELARLASAFKAKASIDGDQ